VQYSAYANGCIRRNGRIEERTETKVTIHDLALLTITIDNVFSYVIILLILSFKNIAQTHKKCKFNI